MSIQKKLFNRQITGVYLLLIGLCIIVKIFVPDIKIYFFILVILLAFSLHIIIQVVATKKRKRLMVLGVTLFLTSLFFLLYHFVFNDYILLENLWPLFGLFPSIGLIIYYLISSSKSIAAIIPGIFLSLFSITLLLITNNIIQLDFMSFLILLIAGMFILTGLYLLFNNKIQEIKEQIDKKINN